MKHLIFTVFLGYFSFAITNSEDLDRKMMYFVIVFTILFSSYIFLYKIFLELKLRKNKAKEYDRIQGSVKKAYLGDYTSLNELLKKEGELKIFKICYFIYRSGKGTWLDFEKLEYPQVWGDQFFQLAMSYFSKFPSEYEDLTDMLNQATFLATVKPNIMKEVCEKI